MCKVDKTLMINYEQELVVFNVILVHVEKRYRFKLKYEITY